MDLSDAIRAFALALDECHSPAMLIDGTISGEGVDLEELIRVLEKHDIEPRIPNALQFAQQHQVLLLVHTPSSTEIELTLAWLPFEQEALARAKLMTIGKARVPVATAEDLLIYKAVAVPAARGRRREAEAKHKKPAHPPASRASRPGAPVSLC